jgi:1-deoxy-D-xylulose-5-phosphate reductoisomerase
MVQFEDGAVKAQLGAPDMRLPIQYAFSYPYRLKADFPRVDFYRMASLNFERPDMERFRNLALAYRALEEGGSMPCVLNAANEVCVAAFLNDKVGFLQMSDIIEKTMQTIPFQKQPSLDDYIAIDAESRLVAKRLVDDFK